MKKQVWKRCMVALLAAVLCLSCAPTAAFATGSEASVPPAISSPVETPPPDPTLLPDSTAAPAPPIVPPEEPAPTLSPEQQQGKASREDVQENIENTEPPTAETVPEMDRMLLTPQAVGIQTFAATSGTVSWKNFAVRQSPGATMPYKESLEDTKDYSAPGPVFYWMSRPYVDGQLAFCVEPEMILPSGTQIGEIGADALFTKRQQQTIALIAYYAFEMGADGDDAVYGAAQMMIWEVCNNTLNYVNLSNNGLLPNIYYGGVAGRWEAEYEALRQAVLHYRTIPSFMTSYNYGAFLNACSYTIPSTYFGGGMCAGEMVLEDYNGVVDQMNWPSDSDFDFEVQDAGHLKIIAKKQCADWKTIGPVTKSTAAAFGITIVILGDGPGNLQDLGQFNVLSDPFGAYLRLRTEGDYEGECQIIKVDSEDGFDIGSDTAHSRGAIARLTYPDGHTEEVALPYVVTAPGDYTVEELRAPLFDDPHLGYVISHEKRTFTVGDDNTWDDVIIQAGVDLPNRRQKGQIIVQKIDLEEDYINHWNILSKATADKIAAGGKDYYIEEGKAVYWEGDIKGEVLNPKAQGDATLAGAWFIVRAKEDVILANGTLAQHPLYGYEITGDVEKGTAKAAMQSLGRGAVKAGSIVAIGQTDAMGVFATPADLDLGVYEVVEIVPSEGYQYRDYAPEPQVIEVDIRYTEQELPVNIHHVNYGNTALKGHISLIKVQGDITETEGEGNGANTPDGPNDGNTEFAESTYWAIYLNSKKDAELDEYGNYHPEIPVLDEHSQPANDGNRFTVLPDEYYVQKPLDPKAPLALPTGQADANGYPLYCFVDEDGHVTERSVNPDHAEIIDANPYNAYNKQLYMVLRTGAQGQAGTRNVSTIVWTAMGGSLSNAADHLPGAMPLPYGTYTVVEINPNEGREAVYGTVRIGYESWVNNSDGGHNGSLRRPELGLNDAGEIARNGKWGTDHDLYGRNSAEDGALTRPVTDKMVKMRLQVVKVDAESDPTLTDAEAVAHYEAALENWRMEVMALKDAGKWQDAVANGTAPAEPRLEDFTAKGAITADKLAGMKIYTSAELEAMGYQPSSHAGFLLWAWNNLDGAYAGNSTTPTPSGPASHNNDHIGDTDYGYWVVQDRGGEYRGTPSSPWMTDDNACIDFTYPLAYGDYTLVEVSSAYGYWLGDAINPTVQGIINALAARQEVAPGAAEQLTQQMIEQYQRRYAAYQTDLAAWSQAMDEWYQMVMALPGAAEARDYTAIMEARPSMPPVPLRLSHDTYQGGNVDVEAIKTSEEYQHNPEQYAWLDSFAAASNIVPFSITGTDMAYPLTKDTVASVENSAGYTNTYYIYNKVLVIFAVNERQKGYLELHKTGMQLTGSHEAPVKWNDKSYTQVQPTWEVLGLADAVYGIYAASDIVTPDGVTHYKTGDLVETIASNDNGLAVSHPLDLGEYYCQEQKAPYGYILDETRYCFTLEYQGQNVRIYPERQWRLNIRQNIQVEIEKLLEQAGAGLGATDGAAYTGQAGKAVKASKAQRFKTPHTGSSSSVDASGVLYGLYAREDIPDRRGNVAIKAGSLIECVEITGGRGGSTLDLPLAKYYLKELDNKDPAYVIPDTEYDFSFLYTADGKQWVNLCRHRHDELCGGLTGEEYCAHICGAECMLELTAKELYDKDLAGTGKGETVIHIGANGGVAIWNLLKRGYVELYKYDGDFCLGLPEDAVTGELQGEPAVERDGDALVTTSTYLDAGTTITVVERAEPYQVGTHYLCTVTRGGEPPHTYEYYSLEGAVFGAFDEAGQLRAVATTDRSGHLLLGQNENALRDGLSYGAWTIRELSSPDGYRITDPEASWTVEITADGQTVSRDVSGALLRVGNQLDNPVVRVLKRDDGGNGLDGAEFTVFHLSNAEEYQNYLDKKAAYDQEAAKGTPDAVPPEEVCPDWQVYRGMDGDEWFVYETVGGRFDSGYLEDGIYRLVETRNPSGFTGGFDQQFVIEADTMARPRILAFSIVNHKVPDTPATPETPHKDFPQTGA